MATTRDIRKRIRSVGNTQKITRAMKMVAAARFRRAQERVHQAAPYAEKIEELLADMSRDAGHPLFTARPVERRALVIFTSDRGLCGSFNAGLIRRVEREAAELILIGRKAISYFSRRSVKVAKTLPAFWGSFSYANVAAFASELAGSFADGTFDQIDLAYNHFVSVITQRPKIVTLVPMTPVAQKAEPSGERLYEPDRDSILNVLVPRALEVRVYAACLHSLASEHGARMTAMDSATRNAKEMIDSLTLAMNRARQATITKELVEIISGAEALK